MLRFTTAATASRLHQSTHSKLTIPQRTSNDLTMTDLITSTFAQLCCFCCAPSQTKRRRSDEAETDAEALEKARQWRERMASAEAGSGGGRPPSYLPPPQRRDDARAGGMQMEMDPPSRTMRQSRIPEESQGTAGQDAGDQRRVRGPSRLMQTEEVLAAHAQMQSESRGPG